MTHRSFVLAGLTSCALLTACGGGEATDAPVTAQPAPAISVVLVTVENRDVQSWIFGEGTARAKSREFLSFDTAGRIAYVDQDLKEGDPVKKGQVIAYLQQDGPDADIASARARTSDADTQLSIAKASEREAAASLDLAQKTFERYATLLQQRSASQQEYDEAAVRLEQAKAAMIKSEQQVVAAGAQLAAVRAQLDQARVIAKETRLVSPIDGLLARLNIEQGYYFSPQIVQTTSEQAALNTVPVVIIDPSQYEITIDIPAYSSDQIKTGSPVLIEKGGSSAGPSTRLKEVVAGPARDSDTNGLRAEVYAVSPSFDPATRTFQVRLRTVAGETRLRDGEFVTTWIAGRSASSTVAIPQGATRFADNEAFVFVYDQATETVARTVIKIGLQGDGYEQVLSGLQPGMRIVTEGRSRLSDGDRVRIIVTATQTKMAGDVK
jgi:RND family efflux transporter MFP subunit